MLWGENVGSEVRCVWLGALTPPFSGFVILANSQDSTPSFCEPGMAVSVKREGVGSTVARRLGAWKAAGIQANLSLPLLVCSSLSTPRT